MKGHVRKRGAAWCFVLELPRSPGERRKQKWTSGFRTRKEAQAALTKALHELQAGTYVEPSRITLGELLDRWLRDVGQHRFSPSTYEDYERTIRNHLRPALGAVLLVRLKATDVQAYYTQKLESGCIKGQAKGHPLAPNSVLHHHKILKGALAQAVAWQLLARSPVEGVKPPREVQEERPTLTEAEAAELLAAARGTRLYMPILLAMATGERRGEILGARWTDLNWTTGVLAVQQALKETKAGVHFGPPKTRSSRRAVALSPSVLEELRRHRGEQAERRLRLGPDYENFDLICPRDDGRPQIPSCFSRDFGLLRQKLQIPPGIHFHDLRHTHITQLLESGELLKVVTERVGHANTHITANRYNHVLPHMQEGLALRYDAILRRMIHPPQGGTDSPAETG